MKLSISKKVGFIVTITLVIVNCCVIYVQISKQKNSKINSTETEVRNISHVLINSIKFAMSQGISDIDPFIEQQKHVKNLSELRIIPTNKIKAGSEQKMDNVELSVMSSKQRAAFMDEFSNQDVYRTVEPILSNETCNTCHGTNIGDALAVVSIRYSLAEMNSDINSQSIWMILLGVLGVIVTSYASVFFINKKIVKDLTGSITAIEKLAEGESHSVEVLTRKDEIGNLSQSLNRLSNSMIDRAQLGVNFAEGNFDKEVVMLSHKDSLGQAFQTIKNSLGLLVNDMKLLSDSALEGKLSYRADASKHHGEFKRIIEEVNATLDAVIHPIKESSKALDKIAQGNLTVRMDGDYKGDYGLIKESINGLAQSFNDALANVAEAVASTSLMGNEISSSSEQMAAGAQEQSSQTSEVAATVEEMTKTIYETTKNSLKVAEAAKISGVIARQGGNVVNETIEGMNLVAEVVKDSAEKIQALGKSSDQIGEIAQVIDEIADQTNLLALNAAIEAARAGEQGRGFAVVADEVRKLAERTTKATKEIEAMIKQIQKDTSDAVMAMHKGTLEVENGKELADKAGQALSEIIKGADEVVELSGQVAAASEEQSAAAEQISQNVESINAVTRETASGIHQIAKSAENLNQLTDKLQQLISRFLIVNGGISHAGVKTSSSKVLSMN